MTDEVDYSEEMSGGEEEDRTKVQKKKGRGHRAPTDKTRYAGKSGRFESVVATDEDVQKSVEGYVLMIANVHEEAAEDDIFDVFAEFGEVTNLHLNSDRRTGFVKGYALVEYGTLGEARHAIEEGNGQTVMENKLSVGFAFKKGES